MINPTEENPARKGEPCPLVENGNLCGRPVFARGWCGPHYATATRHDGDPLYPTKRRGKQGDTCTAKEGCDKPTKGRDLCESHRRLMAKYGETTPSRERRFWAKVDKRRGPDACWPWTGWCQKNGYGQYGSTRNGSNLVHRIAYEYLIDRIPDGLVLDHLCHTADPQCADNDACPHRKCCNPKHGEPVTRRENIARGRGGDSWGYVPDPVPAAIEKPIVCVKCGRTDKPVYKSGMCRPCYRKRHEDPAFMPRSERTLEVRFWGKVDKDGPLPYERLDLGRCWIWTAGINRTTGYARFAVKHGEMMDGHRFSYLLAHGSIPEKHDVHHMCLRRACVNPAHLEAVTRSVNLAERMNRRSR